MGLYFSKYIYNCVGNRAVSCWYCNNENGILTNTDKITRGMSMENWLIEVMNNDGYMGIMILIAIENIFPPIPSEIILTFGGFMTTTSSISILGIIISATAGSVIGAIVLYIIGLQLGVARLEIIVDR